MFIFTKDRHAAINASKIKDIYVTGGSDDAEYYIIYEVEDNWVYKVGPFLYCGEQEKQQTFQQYVDIVRNTIISKENYYL